MNFEDEVKRIDADYLPMIEDAQRHLDELKLSYRARKKALARECGYTNFVIEVLKNGGSVIHTAYADGSWWLDVNEKTYDGYTRPDECLVLHAFDEAQDLDFIEEDSKSELPHIHYRLKQPPAG